jgi:hypothetical protein
MKRSEINARIRDSLAFFDRMRVRLPAWGYWRPGEWKGRQAEVGRVVERMLGWDLTDFGGGRFAEKGLILFTLRNGDFRDPQNRQCYAEKILIVEEGQETPFHFHWQKMEDIINRGGGNLVLELYGSTPDEQPSDREAVVRVDGIDRAVPPGGRVVLSPGESICLEPRLYHRFYGQPGRGKVLVGEVSSVNDDTRDNRFLEPQGRFPRIEEDEEPLHLLVTDYSRYLQ